jgi:hypothetical protein
MKHFLCLSLSLFSFSLSVVLFLCLIVASEHRAWGYVDPGSGLLAVQAAASAVAASAYFLRRKIRALLRRDEKKPVDDAPITARVDRFDKPA